MHTLGDKIIVTMVTYYCSNEERDYRYTDHRGDNVDKPVRQKWSYPQEYNVIDEVISVVVYLIWNKHVNAYNGSI